MNHTPKTVPSSSHGLGVLVLLVALGIMTGCSDGASDATPATVPTRSAVADEPTTVPTTSDEPQPNGSEVSNALPIDGTWKVQLTRSDIRNRLEQAGLGKWADDLFRADDIENKVVWIWTFDSTAERARGLWLYPDGVWKAAWAGPLTVKGRQLELGDDQFQTTDTFRWRVSGRTMVLTPLDSTGAVRGIPEKAYAHAYFTTPFTRAGCPPAAGTCDVDAP